MTEAEVSSHAFELIFAFDEIIALGYRENVTLSQIRTYTEMDSHEENIAKMVQKVGRCACAWILVTMSQNKEREAKELAKRKARELQIAKSTQKLTGAAPTGFGSNSMPQSSVSAPLKSYAEPSSTSSAASISASVSSSASAVSTASTPKKYGWRVSAVFAEGLAGLAKECSLVARRRPMLLMC